MPYVNNYQCCGNLVADPKLEEYKGSPYATFIVALNKPGAKKPSYIDCIAWAETALRVLEYCGRGTEVFLSGELETNSFVDAKGLHRKSTSLRIEKFSVVSRIKVSIPGAIKKPELPPLSE